VPPRHGLQPDRLPDLTPDAPATAAHDSADRTHDPADRTHDSADRSVELRAGDVVGYRLHAAHEGRFALQLAGRFSPGDVLVVSAGGEDTRVVVSESRHVVATTIRLDHGESPLRIRGGSGRPALALLTVSPQTGEGTARPADAGLCGFGKTVVDPTIRGDADIVATLSFAPTEEDGHADLLLRAGDLAEGGEGADTRLGVNFLLGYSVQLRRGRIALARHDYDERVLASVTADVVPGTPHRVSVRLRGERIVVGLDGAQVIDVADVLPHAGGATGLRVAGATLRAEEMEVRGPARS